MAQSTSSSSEEELGGLLTEPDDYYQPEPEAQIVPVPLQWVNAGATIEASLSLRLLGSHPLWGHLLWNASVVVAQYMAARSHPGGALCLPASIQPTMVVADDRRLALEGLFDVRGQQVVELGAGAGLPSIVAAKLGAQQALATDYPDADLLENIAHNAAANLSAAELARFTVLGHIWGGSLSAIQDHMVAAGLSPHFNLVILSDLIFNHSAHGALLQSATGLLAPHGRIVVAFSHHRPHLAAKDLNFFALAAQPPFDLQVTYFCRVPLKPMFENDPGDPLERATVHVYVLERPHGSA